MVETMSGDAWVHLVMVMRELSVQTLPIRFPMLRRWGLRLDPASSHHSSPKIESQGSQEQSGERILRLSRPAGKT